MKSVILPALAFGLVAAANGQPAQTKVGIINMQGALISTKDGQKAAQELQKAREPKTKELEGKQGAIRQLQEQLNKGSNTMAEDARNKLMREIDTRTKAFNRELEDTQAEWDAEQNKVVQQLGQRMMTVIDKYARDNGYAIVIDVSSQQTPVLYAASSVDITQEIVKLYDAAAPATPMSSAPSGGSTNAAPPPKPAPVPSSVKKAPAPVK